MDPLLTRRPAAPPNVKAEFGPEAEYIVLGDSIVHDVATMGQCIRCSSNSPVDCGYFGTIVGSASNSNFSDWNYTTAVYILDARFRTIAQTPLATDPAFMASFPPGRCGGTPQHGLQPDTMALITSGCDAMRYTSIKWP